jgi:hypothetical protein
VNHTHKKHIFFSETGQILWSEGLKFDVFLLVTDDTPHLKISAEGRSVSYPKLILVIWTAHALHSVCETVRSLYPYAKKLVANEEKIFVVPPAVLEHSKKQSSRHASLLISSNSISGNLVKFNCLLCIKLWNILFSCKWTWQGRCFLCCSIQEILNNSSELKLLKADSSYIHDNFIFLPQSRAKLEKITNLS